MGEAADDDIRAVWLARAMGRVLEFEREVESERTMGERLAYNLKAQAVDIWQATGSLESVPARTLMVLDAERAETGETREQLIAAIAANPDPFAVAAGKLAGIRRRAAAAMAAAETVDDLRAAHADMMARIALARQAVADAHRGG